MEKFRKFRKIQENSEKFRKIHKKSQVKIYKNEKMNENFYFILIKNKIKMNYV